MATAVSVVIEKSGNTRGKSGFVPRIAGILMDNTQRTQVNQERKEKAITFKQASTTLNENKEKENEF